jgi:hypothetical protein
MNHVLHRLQRLYEWTPVFRTVYKKPVPPGPKTFEVPQTTGKPGWILFTHDNNIPVCVWITPQECYTVPCSADFRVCNDTLLRVERLNKNEFVVADIWLYNSNCIFSCSTFQQRYEWLKEWMCEFVYHFPGVIKLVHKSDLVNPQVRGYEAYTEDIGSKGYYRDDDGTQIVKFRKLALPDCYEAEDGGYLRVPGLNLSKELRLLGDTFKLRCVKEEDGSWSFVSTYKVNAS